MMLTQLTMIVMLAVPYNTNPDAYLGASGLYTTGVAFTDINGDGFPDLVISNGNDMEMQTIQVYLNNAGSFSDTPSWESEDLGFNCHLDLGDFNDDGKVDVVISEYIISDWLPGKLKIYLGDNSGFFTNEPAWTSSEPFYCFGVDVGDINGDGKLDIIASNGEVYQNSQGRVKVFLNGPGGIDPQPSWESDKLGIYDMVSCADINGDGLTIIYRWDAVLSKYLPQRRRDFKQQSN